MAESKKQSEQHLIDRAGQQLLERLLPRSWVLREYRPDYGLDYAVEVFATSISEGAARTYETLGEHFFIQLKSVQETDPKSLSLYSRGNVEKQRERLNTQDAVGRIETVRFSIETTELVTVERMGVGVPVLLVVADISAQKCYFVCLNDYIDKILIPRFEDYRTAAHRTIHVPVLNAVSSNSSGLVALRWYAKRAKYFAAFHRIVFQYGELAYAIDRDDFLPMARCFASRIAAYDFWDDAGPWAIAYECGRLLKRFVRGEPIGLCEVSRVGSGSVAPPEDCLLTTDIIEIWRRLSVLPRNYEDVCREWFLPTSLGFLCAYDGLPNSPQQPTGSPERSIVDDEQ